MYISSDGIILKQIKASGGRKMMTLFTRNYGKISVGSSLPEKGKSKTALALRPFTYGTYELYKNGDYYNMNSADVKKSFFRIGEDVDKFLYASFAMEVTERLIPEGIPQEEIFDALIAFLEQIEDRAKSYQTIVLAYEAKMLKLLGTFPQLDQCARCGAAEKLTAFSVKDGGMICDECRKKANEPLIYDVKFDIVDILKYFSEKPIDAFEKIALEAKIAEELQSILREYMNYHLDLGDLKSDSIFHEKI